ncbi:DUF6443 domain-containing protein [uncultured Psychroserpens sp.]|uniref:DUF6443 domain-containing protein n=1 Tax=uncultured Psychroserpens sp. TaxID=255436 RepID=UPI002635D144|nr:DUF6443 domain-containing protein [uncultured Psychroserpens sp.]
MKTHIKSTYIKLSLRLLVFIAFSGLGYAQTLTGPSPVDIGSTHTYTYDDGSTHTNHSWSINGGTLESSSFSGTAYSAVINWTSLGNRSILFLGKRNTILGSMPVIVEAATPPPPIATELNYIHNITPRVATTNINALGNSQKKESISYFDGLGRPAQQISIRGGGNNEDIITHIGYDQFGRQTKDYLPYSSSVDISDYRTDALPATLSYYDASSYDEDFPGMNITDINPYSEKELENSPLGKVLKQAAPGKDWKLGNGHEIEMGYLTNSTNEVRYYKVTHSIANNTYTPSLVLNGYYDANELSKSVLKDENHDGSSTKNHTTESFSNKQGQIVLKRTYDNNTSHDTYYIYDDFGNLTYVLPPKAEAQANAPSASELNELCYQYTYDQLNRLVEKKIPGKDWEYIVYNKLDQPIMTQDANLREQGRWLFTKYDVFGRVAYTGLTASGSNRNTLQNAADMIKLLWVTKTTKPYILAGTLVFYEDDNNVYPNFGLDKIYTINYYDNYTFDKVEGNSQTAYGITPITFPTGLATGSKVRVLGTDDWITTVSYYDEKSNPIYVYSHNAYLNTTDLVKSSMLFDGRVEETMSTHIRGGFETINTIDKFEYDHANRMTIHSQNVNGANNNEVIVNNHYDDLGQLVGKGVGGKDNVTSRLQEVDYNYNIRGWLKTINNPDNLGNDLFAFKINYNNTQLSLIPNGNSLTSPLFNGNISETIWKTANDQNDPPSGVNANNFKRGYSYSYDALNRINNAWNAQLNGYSPTGAFLDYALHDVNYDKNGNILNLKRKANYGYSSIDELSYTYDNGNKLAAVTDNAPASYKDEGFKDGNLEGTDYSYDANGNMTVDRNKGIERIDYNHLNLPTRITLPDGDINYIYDATGIKLKKIVKENENTEYAGNYVYENDKLKFFFHPEGYVEPDKDQFRYVYQYKDHLSNIRLSFTDDSGQYQNILDSDFENSLDGWEQNGSVSLTLDSGRLKANVNSSWEGVKHYLNNMNVSPGQQFNIGLVFDKGNTQSNVRLYIQELDASGNHLSWNTINGNLQTGSYNYTYTVSSGNRLVLRVDKNNTNTSSNTHFFIDHISLSRGELLVLEENNYYPFGLKHKGYNNIINGTDHKYGFGGKEEQDELGLGWIDITARNYDPALGRWMNLDPLAEDMRRHSPYNYAFDNPIYFIDPDGMKPFGIVRGGERRVNSSKTNTYGTVNYKSTTTYPGTHRGYKTGYGTNFLGGTSRSHDHTELTVRGNFSGTAITESSTTSKPDTGGILGLINGTPNLADISDTAEITTSKVGGQFYDSDGNKVDSAENASSLVVTTKTVVEAVDLSSDLTNLPENATVTRTDTTTTYSLSNGKYGTIELNQTDQVSTSSSGTISFDEATKELKKHTFNTVKKNIETRSDLVNFHNESFKDMVEELGND